MTPELFIQYLFAGITYGIIYAIVAIGFNIIYNTTGIINFAQGEFVMLGGMTAITMNAFMPMPLAIAAAVLITMVVGALIEMVFIRWLESPSVLRMIIITIGISILAREAALHATAEAVAAVKLARDRAYHAETWEEYEAQDDAFHRSVAEATDNILLLAMFDHLNDVKRAVAWKTVVRTSERPSRDHPRW